MGIYDQVGVNGRAEDAPDVYEPEAVEPPPDTRLFFQPDLARYELADLDQKWQQANQEKQALSYALDNCERRIVRLEYQARAVKTLMRLYNVPVEEEVVGSPSFAEARAESEKHGLPDKEDEEAVAWERERSSARQAAAWKALGDTQMQGLSRSEALEVLDAHQQHD